MQGKLNQFNNGQSEAPYLTKLTKKLPNEKKLGVLGFDNNLNFATANFRWRDDGDRYEKLDGYAFTLEALEAMREQKVSTVYIPDVSEGHVYEYALDQFFGPNAERLNFDNYDRVTPVVSIEHAFVWENHLEDFVAESEWLEMEKIRALEDNF